MIFFILKLLLNCYVKIIYIYIIINRNINIYAVSWEIFNIILFIYAYYIQYEKIINGLKIVNNIV